MTDSEVVKLKNGSEEVPQLVTVTMVALRGLLDPEKGVQGATALYDLVMKCRDDSYQFFGNNQQYLENLDLVESSGTIHQSIKNIVLSAVDGEGMNMAIVNPIA
jgi:hypothetical protein